MWSKLKIRLLSAMIGIVFVLGAIFAPPFAFHGLIAVACVIILYELFRTFNLEKKWQLMGICGVFGLLMLLTPLIDVGFRSEVSVFLPVAYLIVLMIAAVFWHGRICFEDVLLSFFAMIYGVLFPLHLTYIRMMEHGVFLIFLPLIGAWIPDTFAYFSGMLFGKHKLIPNVSPNKTVEGAVGAVVGCVLIFVLYGVLVSQVFRFTVHYGILIFLSVICGVVAQLGDLSASVIKRTFGKKDFGNLIPGHGGIMDRVDSLLFIAPVVYYFLLLFEVICK